MKKNLVILAFGLFLFIGCQKPSVDSSARLVLNFNADWKFCLQDDSASAQSTFDDADWRTLNVPHDWAIEGEFSRTNPSGTGGGALPGGIGWYRKHFKIDAATMAKDQRAFIRFDGVYMNASVYLNGHLLGTRPYGYISFEYEVTPFLSFSEENVLAVRVDNGDQPNSRWYSGCGIYRNVCLTVVNPTYIDAQSTYLKCAQEELRPNVYPDYNSLVLGVRNAAGQPKTLQQKLVVLDADGKEVFSQMEEITAAPEKLTETVLPLDINHCVRWSPEHPYLYTACVELFEAERLVDNYSFRFGIRDFMFHPEKGFVLNGIPTKINGVCMHHDLGCLGSAVNRRAIQRQLEILKTMGCNAIRCSHNPPSVELLDLCDEMGFLVMDEAFDMWRRQKTQRDYARFFDEWHERDLTDLVCRDRNHPSVVMWSIGNEVLEQWTDAQADTLSLEEANLLLNLGRSSVSLAKEGEVSVNTLLTQKLASLVKSLDPYRPVTAGCNEPNPNNHLFRSGALDIIGYNYHETYFLRVPEWFSGKPFLVTESVSGLSTRGYYRMPSDHEYVWPSHWDRTHQDSSFMCSSYDNCHVPWGSTQEKTLRYVEDFDFISGQFVWTGFDYLGEPTPYGWPARSSYFGLVDLAGFPKDAYYLYQSVWTDKPMLHVFPHWNWNTGELVDVWAYFNYADEAELFVNGRSFGVHEKGKNYHTAWRVPFEPGVLKVVTRQNGREVLTKEIRTAGEPAQIRLTPDRSVLMADGTDLSFVTVEIVDKEGNLCPNADNLVQFELLGKAFIAGVDNGCQTSMESFKAPYRKAFFGKCLVVVQNTGQKGSVKLKALSKGLRSAAVTLQVK